MKDDIVYIGEHTWLGQLGNGLISLAFAAALFACVTYIISYLNPEKAGYKKLARTFFTVHTFSVIGIACSIFYMMFNHFYEFAYVWQHTSSDTESRYLFAAFWESQEGSFVLWAFWHSLLGMILMFTSKKWEAPVLATLSVVQAFLMVMVMGVYFGDKNFGNSPFMLMRDHSQYQNLPLFDMFEIDKISGQKVNEYVDKLGKTARGLNPLLKNYWMTIHPPTVFLGFALTVVPFCFSIAGMFTGRHNEWQKTALPWAFVGVLVLGTGILMGGAWAYEALSFGGFWAWDPVENASLVPWLTLVGAAHLMLINKATGHSVFSTYLFSVISFVLVLYSTFLTRSGILGDSSVHAFTDLGMQGLLLQFLLFFIALPVTLIQKSTKMKLVYFAASVVLIGLGEIAGHRTWFYTGWGLLTLGFTFAEYFKNWANNAGGEESAWSREFWIFIGSLILFLLAIAISFCTSFSVFNKMFGTKLALKDNGFNSYNIIGSIAAMLLSIVIGIGQFFKYKKTNLQGWWKNMVLPLVSAFAITTVVVITYVNQEAYDNSTEFQRTVFFLNPLFIFFSSFCLFANIEYWIRILKGKIKNAGASIAHAGFALILIGCLISNAGKRNISKNTSSKDISSLGKKFSNNTNILLEQGDTLRMGGYRVTYRGMKKEGINIKYEVAYLSGTGKPEYLFSLFPRIQLNERMGNTAEPDTRHFLNKDVYTDVTFVELTSKEEQALSNGWSQTENHVLHIRDSIVTTEHIMILDSLKTSLTEEQFKKEDSALVVTAVIRIMDMQKNVYKAYPRYILRNNMVVPDETIDSKQRYKFHFWKINPEEGSVEITLSEKVADKKEFIVMEALEFPWINILWTGCLVMIIGTVLAIVQRLIQNQRSKIENN